jgi:hypothetical protein
MGVKFYADDAFGTADIITPSQLLALVQRAHSDGWQIAVHAVNESGVEMTLNAFETVLGVENNDAYRYRIEHAVKVSDDQLTRMLNKRIIASFQLLGPADWPVQRTFRTYISNNNTDWIMRWKDFIDAGVPSVGSTDAPFNNAPCDYSPFKVIYQAVTRNGYTMHPQEIWELNQRLTREQAVKLLTVYGAYATFEENIKGSITPGYYADLIIVSHNPLTVSPVERLLDIDVLLTLVGARMEYNKEGYEFLVP